MSRGFYSSDNLRFCAFETPLSIHVNPNRQAALLVALLLFGAALRFYGLDEKIIWHDEVATRVLSAGATLAAQMEGLYSTQVLTVAQVLQFQQVQQASSVFALLTDLAQHDPQHPPLYYVLAKGWVQLWGDSVFTLRGLSVFFGVLALPALYWLMRELAATRRAALLAVLLLCVSPLMILYSQEAREYALWALTLLLSSAALLRALRLSVVVANVVVANAAVASTVDAGTVGVKIGAKVESGRVARRACNGHSDCLASLSACVRWVCCSCLRWLG